MKKMKKIMAAAIAMMTFSTAAAVTGTVAWFTANNIVSATNMTVQAQAEEGIVIAAYTGTNDATAPAASAFADTADGNISVTGMLPTFTADCTTWYHANSKKSDDGQAYTADGYQAVTNGTSTYYLVKKYQIKSLGANKDIWVESITPTEGSQAYDPALRVAVKTSSATKFFAPIGAHTGSEAADHTIEDDDLTAAASITFTTVNTADAKVLSNVGSTPVDVEIFIYFDGEDTACKSDNITNFSSTTFAVNFEAHNVSA